jgi:methyl-accepting chemotaxis protein
VRSVAGATEELGASIREISEQASQANSVVAARERDRAERRPAGRPASSGASRIGDVVKLIRASPSRPTCSRSTPPSRRRARASRARLRGGRLGGEDAREPDRQGDRGDRTQIGAIQGSTAEAVEAIRQIAA